MTAETRKSTLPTAVERDRLTTLMTQDEVMRKGMANERGVCGELKNGLGIPPSFEQQISMTSRTRGPRCRSAATN
jgi:hypothetical protein